MRNTLYVSSTIPKLILWIFYLIPHHLLDSHIGDSGIEPLLHCLLLSRSENIATSCDRYDIARLDITGYTRTTSSIKQS